MRSAILISVALLSVTVAAPQRAQLPRKGRTAEARRKRARKPIRKLPRKKALVAARPSRLQEYLTRERARQGPPRPTPEDRLRGLARATPVSAPASPLAKLTPQSYDPLPRRFTFEIASILPIPIQPDVPVPNRWRVEFPAWQRYDDTSLDTVYARSHWWDPFNRNVIKGDYPIFGRRNFLNFTGSSETLVETRRVPVPSVASADQAGDFGFFGRGDQFAMRQSFRLSFDLFRGSAGFRPVDYELRITPEININYLRVRENGLTRADVRERTARTGHQRRIPGDVHRKTAVHQFDVGVALAPRRRR